MRFPLTIFILLVSTFELFSQNGTLIEGKGFTGAIFPANYQMPFRKNPPEELRFSPTEKEIANLEEQLKKSIKEINADKIDQGQHFGPVIHKNLKKYVRQYIGFITPEGERVILVNFLWYHQNIIERIKGYELWSEDFQEDWLTIHDGGSRYWQIKYNLVTSEFIDFWVNGVA